ncbi:hypothetical protein [Nocardia sp. NPDC005978]|uniref:hypothetical protein n=1 Tax=unclassified Nocardia TaxID=2637762 RepID=UPI0033AD234E
MKRIFVGALAAGALVLGLSACGSDTSTGAASTSESASVTAAAAQVTATAVTTPAAPPVEPPAAAPVTTVIKKNSAPNGAQTTCGEFRELDGDTEIQVIQQVLAANPGSKFAGSPNVALSTAKLVCGEANSAGAVMADAIGATAR